MLKEKEAVFRKIIMLFDGIMIIIAFLVAHLLREKLHLFGWNFLPPRDILEIRHTPLKDYLFVLIPVVFAWCLLMHKNGMYLSLRTRKYSDILWIILKSSFIVGLTFGSLVFILKLTFVSRLFFLIFFAISIFFIFSEKTLLFIITHYIRKLGLNYRTLLIIGTGPRALQFINKVKSHPEWGMKILGAIDDEPGRGIQKVNSVEVIGTLADVPDILRNSIVDDVIFMIPRSRLNFMQDTIYACETVGISATIAVDLFDLQIARAQVSGIDGIPFVRFKTVIPGEWRLFIKRIIDMVVSGLALIFMFPWLILSAILIKLTSKGPVFFKQERLGLNGRKFILYKFRTMYQGAQSALENGENINSMNGNTFKVKKQKWITPIGKILRRLSIDEFPQILNVFIGHMSVIGPRPTISDEVTQYIDWQRRRFSMKPGLTCLWQIKGRNKLSHEDWMKLDLEYLDNWSLWLDFKILIKTIPIVLFGIGAY
ncbi:MAG: sugar transferase [Candidatus Aminicenantes bacterium]|nr:sugar transferase [Candidatus Aminicenantes bacterium]